MSRLNSGFSAQRDPAAGSASAAARVSMLGRSPPQDAEGTPFEDILAEAVDVVVKSIPRARRRDDDAIRETVRGGVRRAAEEIWGKKPVCHVIIHRL